MTSGSKPPMRSRARLFTLVPAALLLSAFSLAAQATTPTGLFSVVTPITAPVPASSRLGISENNAAALSADGRTALVGAAHAPVGATSKAGKAFIYHYANGQWNQAQEIDDPDAATSVGPDNFGFTLALSADGTAAIIGSWADVGGQAQAGKAYLYKLLNGTWTQVHEFDNPTPAPLEGFGGSGVSISGHGETVAISAIGKTLNGQANAGEVYVYSNASGTWTQAAAIPDPDGAQNDYFGFALSLASNGNSLLVGSAAAVNGQTDAGKAYLYTLANGSWGLAKEFDDPNAASGQFGFSDQFGSSGVSLAGDGQTAVIGASYATSSATNSGAAYVYSNASGSWMQTAVIADPDAAQVDYFGTPVAISGNGQRLLIGSWAPASGTYAHAGKAYAFTLDSASGTWTQTHEFDDPATTAGDGFGFYGVALSADGQSAFITAPFTQVNGQSSAGAAYIFQSPTDLSLALSPRYASVQQYSTESLDATVSNNSTALTANNVVLSFNIPTGLSYIGGNAGNGSCSASGQTATCTLTSLAPGAVWQPTVLATAAKTGTYTGTATVKDSAPDPVTSNNAASASVTVTAYPKNTGSGGGSSGSGGGGDLGLGTLAALGLLMLAGIKRRR